MSTGARRGPQDVRGDAADQESPDRPEAAAAHHQKAGPELLAEVQDGVYRGALQEMRLDDGARGVLYRVHLVPSTLLASRSSR
jgi:hypothetical protein